MATIVYNGVTFEFSRQTGEGTWYPLTRFGRTPANCSVHVDLAIELTDIARSQGVEEIHNFSRFTPSSTSDGKSNIVMTSRRGRSSGGSGKKWSFDFNPFAS